MNLLSIGELLNEFKYTMTWHQLSDERVLDIVESITALPLSNLCLKRNSYINRVFEIERADTSERLIVKFYRPDRWSPDMIRVEHQVLKQLSGKDIAVIPPLVFGGEACFFSDNIPFALFPKKGGRPLDELDDDLWERMGQLVGRVHAQLVSVVDSNRISWRPARATAAHLDTLKQSGCIPVSHLNQFVSLVKTFIDRYDSLFDGVPSQLIHGDTHLGNFIIRPGEGMYLLDFDDMAIGPVVQDLWMLLPGTVDECYSEIETFIEGYNVFNSFPRESLSLIPALKVMRQLHFASWCAVQKDDFHFDAVFPEFGSQSYWSGLMRDILV